MAEDHYIVSARKQSNDTEFRDYIVFLSSPGLSPGELLVPSGGRQLVVYLDSGKRIYLSKISDSGKFSPPLPVPRLMIEHVPERNTYLIHSDFAGMGPEYKLIRMGNPCFFGSAGDFAAYLLGLNAPSRP